MATLQRYVGGATGLGSTIGARQFLDEPGQNRFTQPSVLLGGVSGIGAGALYVTDAVELPLLSDDFLASHAITALPTAAFYAAFPKQRGKTTTEQVQEALLGSSSSGSRRSGGSGNADNGSAGSTEVLRSSRRRSAGV